MKVYLKAALLSLTLLFYAVVALGQKEGNEAASGEPVRATSNVPPFSVSLVLVKADWSKVPAAKEIEAELRVALKDASIPQELLDELPGSGPQILFAPELVGIYSAEHLAELLAWLKTKGLVEKIEPLKAPLLGPDRTDKGVPHMPNYITRLVKPLDFIDLPPLPRVETQPFVSLTHELTWEVTSPQQGSSTFYVKRALSAIIKRRGSEEVSKGSIDDTSCAFALSNDRAAILNAFPAKQDETFREAARKKGFEAVLLVTRGLAAPGHEPLESRLRLPEHVQSLTARKQAQLSWPYARGPRNRGSSPAGTASSGGGPPASGLLSGEKSEGSAGGSSRPSRPSDAEPQIKIFHLQNAEAAALAGILAQLFPNTKMNVGVDHRTNSLIINGPEDELMKVEAILLRLDEAPSPKNVPGKNSLPSSSGAGNVPGKKESPAQDYQKAELAAGEAAKELRDIEHARATLNRTGPKEYQDRVFGRSEAHLKELREGVRAKVATAFAARQAMLQSELAEIETRLREVRETIDQRSKISDEIIDRRVNDLLYPPQPMDATQANQPAPSPKGSGGKSNPALPSGAKPNQVGRAPGSFGGLGGNSDSDSSLIGSPEVLRRLVNDADQELRLRQQDADKKRGLYKDKFPTPEENDAHFAKQFPDEAYALAQARQRAQFAMDQLAAQIRLLTLERDSARAEVTSAIEGVKAAEALYQAAQAPQTIVTAAKQTVERAKLRVERAETLLDLYQKIFPALSPAPFLPKEPPLTKEDAVKVLDKKLGIDVEAAPPSALAGNRFRGGLLVKDVRPDSPAARQSICAGDILVGLHVWETVSPENAAYALQNAPNAESSDKDAPRQIKFYVLRNGETLFGHLSLPGN